MTKKLSLSEARALLSGPKPKSKYKAVRTIVDGISFASRLEAKKYSELKILEKAGHIRDLKLQPRYPLVVDGIKICSYVGDFSFKTPEGAVVVIDCKGMETETFKLKKKLFEALYKIPLTLVKK